jgi:hypothetical protein
MEGRYYRDYVFDATAGARVTIDLESDDFDAYLYLGRMRGGAFVEIAADDAGGAGTNARLTHRFDAAGPHVIRVTSFYARSTGGYALRVERAP